MVFGSSATVPRSMLLYLPAQKQRISLQPWYLIGPTHQSAQRTFALQTRQSCPFFYKIRFFFLLQFAIHFEHFSTMYCTYNIGIDRARIDEMHSIEAGFRTECVADPINHGILDVLKQGVSSTHMHKFDRSFSKKIYSFFFVVVHLLGCWYLLVYEESYKTPFCALLDEMWIWIWDLGFIIVFRADGLYHVMYAYHAWVGGNIDTKSEPFRVIFPSNLFVSWPKKMLIIGPCYYILKWTKQ